MLFSVFGPGPAGNGTALVSRIGGASSKEGPPQLRQIGAGHRLFSEADVARPDTVLPMVKRTSQVIPQRPELAEVHLRVLVLALVMPAVDLGDAEQVAKGPEGEVEVRVLEGEVHGDDRHPSADRLRRRTEQDHRRDPGHRENDCREWMATLSVQPVEALRAVVQRMQASEKSAAVACPMHRPETEVDDGTGREHAGPGRPRRRPPLRDREPGARDGRDLDGRKDEAEAHRAMQHVDERVAMVLEPLRFVGLYSLEEGDRSDGDRRDQ